MDFTDPTYGMSAIAIWGSVEVNIAIICACAATLKPLVNKCFPHAMKSSSQGMTQSTQPAIRSAAARQNTRNNVDGKGGPFVRLRELELADGNSEPSSPEDLEHGLRIGGSTASTRAWS